MDDKQATRLARAIGSVVGLATGDALGSTVEFKSPDFILREYGPQGQTEMRGGGHFNWQVGDYTDDGQMMMCLLNSLVETNQALDRPVGLDVHDLGRRFVAWYDSNPPDVGTTTASSIQRLKKGAPATEAGNADPSSQANGAVMRCSPVAVLWHLSTQRPQLIRDSLLSAVPTHRSEVATWSAVVANLLIAEFINGTTSLDAALKNILPSVEGEWRSILNTWIISAKPHRGNSGWAVSTVLTALHCLDTTESYEAAVIKAVNGGDDADTVGAVTGALVGAFYGVQAIPERWLSVLKDRQLMTDLAQTLFEIGER